MSIEDLYTRDEYIKMSPLKKKAVEEVCAGSEGTSFDKSLPLLLNAGKRLKEAGETFSKEETAFLLSVFTEKLSAEEKKKVSALLKLLS